MRQEKFVSSLKPIDYTENIQFQSLPFSLLMVNPYKALVIIYIKCGSHYLLLIFLEQQESRSSLLYVMLIPELSLPALNIKKHIPVC